MGRLVRPREFIHSNIEEYNTRATSNMATLLESTPIFGTYYHQHRIFTTNDKGLENVEDDLGRDSPIKYEKIEAMPFYGADNLSLQIERGEVGLNSNIESELIILPNTIKPYPNDYFTLDILGPEYLFKVTEYQEDMIKSKPYYRISFRLGKIQDPKESEMEAQVVEEYTTMYNNIGTDNTCIIKSSTYKIIDGVEKLSNKLIDFYIKTFYDKNNNILLIRNKADNITYYNRYLNKFIIDNNLFTYSNKQDEFYKTIKLVEYIPLSPEDEENYEYTIYNALITNSTKQFLSYHYLPLKISYPHVPWTRSNNDYKLLTLFSINDNNQSLEDRAMLYIDKETYGRIMLDNKYIDNDSYYMENTIIDFIHNKFKLPTIELIEKLNTTSWRKDWRAYIYIPIMIYILRTSIREELIKLN